MKGSEANMFGFIRIIFWGIVLGIIVLILKKKNRMDKKTVSFSVIAAILFCTISGIIPIENYIITFTTPEKAFHYIHPDEVKLVIDGQESSLIIGEESNTDYIYLIIPKCPDGWKLGRGIDTELVAQTTDEDIVINLYHYKETCDYYITIIDMSGNLTQIVDRCDSAFVTFDNKQLEAEYRCYFAFVCSYDENYWIKVNNQEYRFS